MAECVLAPRVLVADDQPDILEALRLLLREAGFAVACANSVQTVRERLIEGEYDLLLMDLNYARDTTSGREGLDLLAELHQQDGSLPIVVMTGWGSIETAVEAMRRGARTFVQKPWDNAMLAQTIWREVADGRASREAGIRESRELENARLVQRALLPDSLPSVSGCDIAAMWKPAGPFGGDCYDIRRLSETRVALSIADVAGKGLPAALLMTHLQACSRAYGGEGSTPRDLVAHVNRSLCGNPNLATFVTFCHIVVDSDRQTLTFCNAGHNPPILARADGTVVRLTAGGLVLGVLADAPYEQGELALCAGDRLVLFTDGITEAQGMDGSDFGDTRLVEAVVGHRHLAPQDLLDAIFDEVRALTGGVLHDDATLVAVAM